MSSKFRNIALLGFTCLATAFALPCLAETSPVPAIAALTPGSAEALPQLHSLDSGILSRQLSVLASGAQTTAAQQFPAAAKARKMVAAGDVTAPEGAVSSTQTVAMSAAKDSATMAGVCQAYFDQSVALAPSLSPAFQAMSAREMTKLTAMLPDLEKQLQGLTPYEIAPEVCGGTHINAYTSYQFTELSTLRAHGVDIGMPAALPIIKQPDLNQGALAYAVGWIKYEQKDFDGALAAYSKGLAMFPHDHNLQSEYIGTLLQLQRGQDTVNFADSVLEHTYDMDDGTRAKMFAARAIGLLFMGAIDAADDSFTISLYYRYDESVSKMRDEVRAAAAKAKAK